MNETADQLSQSEITKTMQKKITNKIKEKC